MSVFQDKSVGDDATSLAMESSRRNRTLRASEFSVGYPVGTDMSVAERLQFGLARARNKFGDSVTSSLGKSDKQISRYLAGADFPFSFVQALSQIAEIPIGWFAGEPAIAEGPEGRVLVPRYDVRASAGAGALVLTEDVAEYLSVGREWLRRALPSWAPPNAVVGILEGAGDSMEPTIRDGDLLMVVQGVEWRTVELGGIFVLSVDDRVLLKRLEILQNGDLNIISDNKAYSPWIVKMEEIDYRVQIHGFVFFGGGKLRTFR